MAEPDQLARPVMRRVASLDADQARGSLAKNTSICDRLSGPTNNDLTGCINAMDLKNVLGRVEADRGNLHGGWLPFCS